MGTRDIPAEPDGGDATPVACTLGSADLTTRRERWLRLGAQALIERRETADGLRISFRPEFGVEDELRTLIAVENECCSWANWNVRADAAHVILEVSSSGEGIAALHGMFTSLELDRGRAAVPGGPR